MKFDFYTLEAKEMSGESLGKWKGVPIYSCNSARYDAKKRDGNTRGAYLIYDNGNALVIDGQIFGNVNVSGEVKECNPRTYRTPQEMDREISEKSKKGFENMDSKTSTTFVPLGEKHCEVCDIDVDALLKSACDVSGLEALCLS